MQNGVTGPGSGMARSKYGNVSGPRLTCGSKHINVASGAAAYNCCCHASSRSKRNELGILSNFAATPFEYRGKRYASVEGFWQMMLYPEGPDDPRAKSSAVAWPHTREQVAQMVAFEAKAAGDVGEKNMRKL